MVAAKYLDPADGQWKYLEAPPHTHPGQTRLVGEVIAFAGAAAPAGWLVCDGSEQPIATYPDLAALLGTIYGTASSGNFRIPDLRGVSVVGPGGSMTGALGTRSGATTHGHTGNALPTHTHGNTADGGGHTHGTVARSTSTSGGHSHTVNPPSTASTSAGSHSHTASATANTSNNVGSGSGGTFALGGHTHATGSNGSHTHNTDIAPFSSGTEAGHTHNLAEIATGTLTGGSHAHGTTAVSAGTPSVQASSSYHPVLALNYLIFTGE